MLSDKLPGGGDPIPKRPGHFDRFVVVNATYTPMEVIDYTLVDALGAEHHFQLDHHVEPGDGFVLPLADVILPVEFRCNLTVDGLPRPMISIPADPGQFLARVDLGRVEQGDNTIMPFQFGLQVPLP